MSTKLTKQVIPRPLEDSVNALLNDAQQSVRHQYKECEERIRKSPTSSVLGAVAVGWVLHRLPVRALLVAQVRLLTALAPPAILLFSAAKACEFLQRQASGRPN